MIRSDIESGLQISVQGEWVIKFDEHPFYKKFSGRGFKGVDYMIVNPDYLYLIEIKNYGQYEHSALMEPSQLHLIFLEKCDDALAIIEAFYTYLESGFWTRVFVLKYRWFFTCPKEWKYWIKAYELFQKKQVILLLHAE